MLYRLRHILVLFGYLRELEDIYHLCFGIHATPLPNSNPQLVPQVTNSSSNSEEKEQVSSSSSPLACSLSQNPPSNNALREQATEQPSGPEAMYRIVEQLVAMDATERRALYQLRRQKMLSDKIDCAQFLTWFIENYPQSAQQVREVNASSESEFWEKFK